MGVVVTAWVAAALWFVGSAMLLRVGSRWARRVWAVGCVAFFVHSALAFHVVHGWSHAAAFDHVERDSGFGAGIFVNYLFGLVWATDSIWIWVSQRSYWNRPRWVLWTVHGFLAFVVFNATVVYAATSMRWAALAGFGVLAWQAKNASAMGR